MDEDQIRLLLETKEHKSTEFDEIGGRDEDGVYEVEYICRNSDCEQSLDDDYEDNDTHLSSTWSDGPQFIGKEVKHFGNIALHRKIIGLDVII